MTTAFQTLLLVLFTTVASLGQTGQILFNRDTIGFKDDTVHGGNIYLLGEKWHLTKLSTVDTLIMQREYTKDAISIIEFDGEGGIYMKNYSVQGRPLCDRPEWFGGFTVDNQKIIFTVGDLPFSGEYVIKQKDEATFILIKKQ
jgi:hypothetical protein